MVFVCFWRFVIDGEPPNGGLIAPCSPADCRPKFSRRKQTLLDNETGGQESTLETSILFLKTHS
jgi:hypothetical protein